MLRIDDTLISLDLIERNFCCYLDKCKGQCCVKGDSGAPLISNEVELLPAIIEKIKPYMRPEGIEAIEKQGTHVIDTDHEEVTPLIDGLECAYTIFEDGIAKCAIEKAWLEKVVDFQKPVSCHLYPVRVKTYNSFEAINYDKWDLCQSARILGDRKGIPVYKFAKDALIRRFGNNWFEQLQIAAKEIESMKQSKKG
jgi:hypothetical protein